MDDDNDPYLNPTIFRHTGAINVFERTRSLVKLQTVMGHSDLKVTLTYLRGLQISRLTVDDMPEV